MQFAAGSIAMPIEAASSIRAAASDEREASRAYRHEVSTERAYFNRDQRVQEAKASEAARPTLSERAAEAPPPPPRAPSGSKIFDVLA
jgi:hypothetical protein